MANTRWDNDDCEKDDDTDNQPDTHLHVLQTKVSTFSAHDITSSVFAHLPPHLLADLVGTAAELLGCALEIVRLVPEVVEIVTTSFRKHDVLLHHANGLVELLYVISS